MMNNIFGIENRSSLAGRTRMPVIQNTSRCDGVPIAHIFKYGTNDAQHKNVVPKEQLKNVDRPVNKNRSTYSSHPVRDGHFDCVGHCFPQMNLNWFDVSAFG